MSDEGSQAVKSQPGDRQWLSTIHLVMTMVLAALGLWLNFSKQQRQALEDIQAELVASRNERVERGARTGAVNQRQPGLRRDPDRNPPQGTGRSGGRQTAATTALL